MNFFNLFKKSKPTIPEVDYSLLAPDIHAHLIPGIDDGPGTMAEALELIRGLRELGYRKLITTPHVMSDYYPNTRGDILKGLKAVQKAVKKAGIDVELDAAAEYMIDDQFRDKVEAGELLTFPDGRHVLVEFSFVGAPPHAHEDLFVLQTKGFTPILAHPERYAFFHGDMQKYRELKDYGCRFQLNLLSLAGYYGYDVKRNAEILLQEGYFEFAGTDLHHQRHLKALQAARRNSDFANALTRFEFDNDRFAA